MTRSARHIGRGSLSPGHHSKADVATGTDDEGGFALKSAECQACSKICARLWMLPRCFCVKLDEGVHDIGDGGFSIAQAAFLVPIRALPVSTAFKRQYGFSPKRRERSEAG